MKRGITILAALLASCVATAPAFAHTGVDLHFNVGLGAFERIFGTSTETFAG